MKAKQLQPGTRFGRLVVIRPAGKDPKTCKSLSQCRCDCGALVVKRNNDLLTERIVSCGCARRERASRQMYERAERSNAHHMSGTPVYQCWHDMMDRCYDCGDKSYARYGGRGIRVCQSWKKFVNFERWALANGYSVGLQIDRIDFDKGYGPKNCRFVDVVTQANNRSNNRFITYKGRTMTVAQWSRALDAPYGSLKRVTRKGGSLERFDKDKPVRLAAADN